MKQNTDSIDYVYNFLNGTYIDQIKKLVFDQLADLKNYVVVGASRNPNKDQYVENAKPPLDNLNPFDINSYGEYIKLVNQYIKESRLVYEFQKDIPDIILPDESTLYDTAITVSCTAGLPYTLNLDVLLYGKPVIYSQDHGEWKCKNREELKSILPKSRKNDSILYTCVLLGTSYARAEFSSKKKDILNDPNKFKSVCELLESQNQLPYLEFIKSLEGN
jgi:hypothetical protein